MSRFKRFHLSSRFTPSFTPNLTPRLTLHSLKACVSSAVLTMALGACVANDPNSVSSAQIAASGDADKLFIVDCLLPGQVRKLGTSATFLTARRPVKTTASICEIRGGEYTSYDRADFRTSLNIWLPAAQSGDPEAQAYVGEIFEKGLGLTADYTAAAEWYGKAASQGNQRAMTNLGHLYEKGLGVKQDKVAALNWYRRASGLNDDTLAFSSSISALQAEVDSSRQQVAAARQEASQLRNQLNQLQGRVQQQDRQQKQTRRDLVRAREQLTKQSEQTEIIVNPNPQTTPQIASGPDKDSSNSEELRRLKKLLAQQIREQSRSRKEAELLKERLEAEAAGAAAVQAQLNAMEQQLVQVEQEKQQLTSRSSQLSAQQNQSLAQAQADLEQVRQAMEQQRQALAEQSNVNAQNAELQLALQESSERISTLEQELGNSRQQSADQADLEVQRAQLNQARLQLERTRLQLERQRDALSARENSEVQKLSAQLQGQETELQRKEEEIGALLQQLIASNEELAKTDGQIAALEQETTQVREQLVAMRGTATTAAAKPALPQVEFGNYHALVIGNNNYADFPNLKTAVSDAQDIANTLSSRYGFKVQLLTNATRYQILTALNQQREKLSNKDNFLLYYAGHGEYDNTNTRGHWLPVDAEPNSTANWVPNEAITDILNAMTAKHVMVIADSCYSGALTRSVTTSLEGGRSSGQQAKWLKLMVRTRSRTVLSSGGLAPVLDGGGGGNSVFAKQLLDVLRDNQEVLEGPLLYRAVSKKVKVAASRFGVEQNPQYSPIKFAGDLGAPFFFRPTGA